MKLETIAMSFSGDRGKPLDMWRISASCVDPRFPPSNLLRWGGGSDGGGNGNRTSPKGGVAPPGDAAPTLRLAPTSPLARTLSATSPSSMTLSARPLGLLSSTGEYQLQTVMAWTSTLASQCIGGESSSGMLLPPDGEHRTQPLFGTTPDDLVELDQGLSPRLEVGERLSSAPR